MKVLLLEPHGDDALLSCWDLLRSDNKIDILTFSARDSTHLSDHYPSIKNTKYFDCSNLWYPTGKPILKTHQVHHDFLDGKPINYNYVEQLIDVFQDEYFRDYNEITDKLGSWINNHKYDVVVCCAGVVHPYHVLLREVWMTCSNSFTIPTLWYSDKYYVQNRYGKEMYEDLKKYLGCDTEVNPGWDRLGDKNKEVEKVLADVYPSELNLLRFYSEIILYHPCKYMYNSSDTIINELVRSISNAR